MNTCIPLTKVANFVAIELLDEILNIIFGVAGTIFSFWLPMVYNINNILLDNVVLITCHKVK